MVSTRENGRGVGRGEEGERRGGRYRDGGKKRNSGGFWYGNRYDGDWVLVSNDSHFLNVNPASTTKSKN